MTLSSISEKWDLRFLLKSFAAWAVSAFVLLLLASLVVSKTSMGRGSIGYVSSGVSFISAAFAGAFAARTKKAGGFYTGLMTATVISTLLLTVGFIIEGAELESSGVLSVVTFTFSGCLVGSVFFGTQKNRARKTRFTPKLRR